MVGSDTSSVSPPEKTPAASPKQYGVTKPLSRAGPTEADIQRTKELEKVCVFRNYLILTLFLCFLNFVSYCILGDLVSAFSFCLMLGYMRVLRRLQREKRFLAD